MGKVNRGNTFTLEYILYKGNQMYIPVEVLGINVITGTLLKAGLLKDFQ